MRPFLTLIGVILFPISSSIGNQLILLDRSRDVTPNWSITNCTYVDTYPHLNTLQCKVRMTGPSRRVMEGRHDFPRKRGFWTPSCPESKCEIQYNFRKAKVPIPLLRVNVRAFMSGNGQIEVKLGSQVTGGATKEEIGVGKFHMMEHWSQAAFHFINATENSILKIIITQTSFPNDLVLLDRISIESLPRLAAASMSTMIHKYSLLQPRIRHLTTEESKVTSTWNLPTSTINGGMRETSSLSASTESSLPVPASSEPLTSTVTGFLITQISTTTQITTANRKHVTAESETESETIRRTTMKDDIVEEITVETPNDLEVALQRPRDDPNAFFRHPVNFFRYDKAMRTGSTDTSILRPTDDYRPTPKIMEMTNEAKANPVETKKSEATGESDVVPTETINTGNIGTTFTEESSVPESRAEETGSETTEILSEPAVVASTEPASTSVDGEPAVQPEVEPQPNSDLKSTAVVEIEETASEPESEATATVPEPEVTAIGPESVTEAVLDATKAEPESEVATPVPEPEATEVIPEPEATKSLPEPEATASVPEPEATASVPEPETTIAVPEPEATAVVPEPEATEAVPKPEGTAAVPEPEATAVVPEPEVTEAVPKPEATAAVPEPEATAVVPEPEVTEAVPKPETTVGVPEPEATEAVPKPEATVAAPEPEVTAAVPEPEATAAIPKPEVTAAGPEVATSVSKSTSAPEPETVTAASREPEVTAGASKVQSTMTESNELRGTEPYPTAERSLQESSTQWGLYIGIPAAAIFVVTLLGVVFYLKKKRARRSVTP